MRGSGSAKRDPLLRAPDFDSLPGPPDPADKGHQGRGGRMLPVAVRKRCDTISSILPPQSSHAQLKVYSTDIQSGGRGTAASLHPGFTSSACLGSFGALGDPGPLEPLA